MCFQEESPLFAIVSEDVHKFPESGIGVMDSNAAKEMIHSCPIATYEAPINSGSPRARREQDRDERKGAPSD